LLVERLDELGDCTVYPINDNSQHSDSVIVRLGGKRADGGYLKSISLNDLSELVAELSS
jgi:hypothetical protein